MNLPASNGVASRVIEGTEGNCFQKFQAFLQTAH